jgi:putative ABC transport system ATP-binding protein
VGDAPIVAITHLTKSYRRGDQVVPVLRDITLAIPRGDFIALMGPSGSGKSTLLNLIAGIDKPDSGELLVGGEDITRLGEAELADWRASNVGFIFQFYNLMPVLDAFENVELPLLLTSLGKRDRRERVETALSLVGLSDRMEHYPERAFRRPAAARGHRARAHHRSHADRRRRTDGRPRPQEREEILGLLRRLNTEMGKTIVMVTHDAHAVESARHVTHLEKGELLSS